MNTDEFGGVALEEAPAVDEFGGKAIDGPDGPLDHRDEFGGLLIQSPEELARSGMGVLGPVPHDALERAAQNLQSMQEFRASTGSKLTMDPRNTTDFDRPLLKIVPELSDDELQTLRAAPADQQRSAAAANTVAKSINSLTSFNNLGLLVGTMGLGLEPILARTAALGFATYMGKHAAGAAHELALEFQKPEAERDPQKIGSLMAEGGVDALLAGVSAAHGVKSQSPAARVAHELSKQVGRADLGTVEPAAIAGGPPTIESVQTSEPAPSGAATGPAAQQPEVSHAEQILSATPLNGDVLHTPGTIEGPGEMPAAESGPGIPPRGQGEIFPAPTPGAPQEDLRGVAAPHEQIERVASMGPDEFFNYAQGGKTRESYELGRSVDSPEQLQAMAEARTQADIELKALQQKARASGSMEDLNAMSKLAAKPQYFSEAYGAATGTGSAGEYLRQSDPTYRPPFPEVPSQTAIAPRAATVAEVPVAKIRLSEDVPNFKAESSAETGVVKGQELQGKFERLGTAPIVVWRRLNGDLEVITGRHRLDLAKRSGEKTIPAQIVDEAKGFTRPMALKFDAEANIRDGQGSVEDYAHYFQNSPGLTEEEARSRGLLSRAKGNSGWDLGRNASDDLRALWRSGKVSEAQAVAIARTAPADARLQRVGAQAALRGEKPEILSNLVRVAQLETVGKPEQLDLLGSDDSAMKQMQSMARRAANAQRTISEQIRAVQGAAKRPELARELGVDVGDPQALLQRVEALKAQQARWQNWPMHPDLVDQVRGPASPPPGDLFAPRETATPASRVVHSMSSHGTPPGVATRQLPAPPARLPAPVASLPAPKVGPIQALWTRARVGLQSRVSPQNIDPAAKAFSHILRENNAQAALEAVRADAHIGELRAFFDHTPVPKGTRYDPAKPIPYNYAVMDAFERNRSALPERLQDLARAFDAEFAWRVAEVQKIKPNALQSLISEYFPHMWQEADAPNTKAIMVEMAAKAPFEGSKAFMRQRTVPYFLEGWMRGLDPISDNPIDLLAAKMHQMDKYLAAAKTMQEAKANGMLKYFPLGRKIPGDRVVVNDPAFTVHAPPFLEVHEAHDAGLRKGLLDFITKMGFRYERVAKLGINEWGQYTTGKGEIKARVGGPDGVIMHEIGHGLEERYSLSNYLLSNETLRQEMRDLAELRARDINPTKKFRNYIQTPDEQVANAVHGYMYAPEEMARVAPTVQTVLRNIIRAHPELEDLNEIKPGLALKSETTNVPLPGPVLAGHWTLPTGPAAVLKNYLSPGLSRWLPYRTVRAASNILNAAQLGLSGFHVGFTSLDATVSSVATGFGYLLRGDLKRAVKSFAFAPVAPVANYYVGKAVQLKMIDPTAAAVPIGFPKLGLDGNLRLWPAADLLTRQIAELAVKGGLRAEIDPFWKTNITRSLVRAWHAGGLANYGKAALQLPLAMVEQSMRPIAEYLVPRQKLGVFAQLALQEMNRIGWNARPEEVRAAMARAADSTEDRMGQMTYDSLFMNKSVKDSMLLSLRAFGWQLGKYRHLYGGVSDTASLVKGLIENGTAAAQGKPLPARPQITNRMLYPLALTGVVATVGGLLHRMFTGSNPQTLQDYFFPRTGRQDKDGRDERLALPTYLKDFVGEAHSLRTSWMEKSPIPFATDMSHKLNPIAGVVGDMWNNKDYYGVEIRHPDDPLSKQMAELSQFAVKQFTPFSISGTMKLAEDKAPIAQLLLPFIGVVPAKKALLMSPAQTLAADITREGMGVGGRTREAFDHSQLLKNIVQDIRVNGQPGQVLPQALAAGQLRAADAHTIESMLTTTPLQYQVGRMSPENAMRVWRLASAAERQELGNRLAAKIANSKTLEPEKQSAYLKELVRAASTPAP